HGDYLPCLGPSGTPGPPAFRAPRGFPPPSLSRASLPPVPPVPALRAGHFSLPRPARIAVSLLRPPPTARRGLRSDAFDRLQPPGLDRVHERLVVLLVLIRVRLREVGDRLLERVGQA